MNMSNSSIRIPFKRLDANLPVPKQAHTGDGAADLYAAKDATLTKPGERFVMPTGLAVAVPAGYAGFVLPRSGVSSKRGLGIANAPGLIDSGYRGEIKVILVNNSDNMICSVKRGEKIAQLAVMPVFCPDFFEVENLDETERGEQGFGSTGI